MNGFGNMWAAQNGLTGLLLLLLCQQIYAQDKDLSSAESGVIFSEKRGYFDKPFDLEIRPFVEGHFVIFTTDTSWPSTKNGVKGEVNKAIRVRVDGPMIIRAASYDGSLISEAKTHSFLFRDKVFEQVRPEGFTKRIDFEMGKAEGDRSLGRDRFREILFSIPTVSIAMEHASLFGESGIYLNSKKIGPKWEKLASIEWMDMKKRSFIGLNVGIEIQGAGSRIQSPKQNFELKFKKKYGPKNLRLRVFETTDVEVFDSLVLKNPTHDSWVVNQRNWLKNARYVNDSWSAETQQAMGHLAPNRRWVHLFLNGFYWGIYSLTERPDAAFVAAHTGGGKNDYDALNANRLRSGERARFDYLRGLVKGDVIKTEAAYEKIEDYIDLDGLIDYFLINYYSANIDWPHKNYWVAGSRSEKPRFRFFTWDAETGFFEKLDGARNAGGISALEFNVLETKRFKSDRAGAGFFFRELSKNPEFLVRFSDRLFLHTRSGGALSPEKASARYKKLLDEIEPLLALESLRWGDARQEKPFGPWGEAWNKNVDQSSWLFREFFPKRTVEMQKALNGQSLEPPLLTKSVRRDGRVKVFNPNPQGAIVFTTNGTDPREPWTGKPIGQNYEDSIPVHKGQLVKARVVFKGAWSPVNCFEVE
jgi:hypothetical protein